MKIYTLTVFDIKRKYFIENAMFTSKKTALESKKYLINYLIANHSLDAADIKNVCFSGCDTFSRSRLSNRYNVTLTDTDTKSKVLKYV
jgi:hypothetical protein